MPPRESASPNALVDRASWLAQASRLATSYEVHPACSGIVAGLLHIAQEIGEAELIAMVEQRVSDTLAPERAAAFVAGVLEVNALVLVKSRAVVAALDAFLVGIEKDRFKDAVPILRRAFSALGATERRYLVENLVAVRKLGAHAPAARAIIAEEDKAKLAAMSDDIAKAMDDLDDLL